MKSWSFSIFAGFHFNQGLILDSAGFRQNGLMNDRIRVPISFCVLGTPLPVCLRVGFQFGGRINDREKKHFVR